LGPAPIKAIKEGITHIGYDCSFVFGEVNADRITWVCGEVSENGQKFYPIKDRVIIKAFDPIPGFLKTR
jgi:hypothetical protein